MMKEFYKVRLLVLMTFFVSTITQAQTKTVTLTTSNDSSSYSCSTNQIITINSFIANAGGNAYANISFFDGRTVKILPYPYGTNSANSFTGVAVFTGVTSVSVISSYPPSAALTFTLTTPTDQSSLPSNAVVIPTDATGPVQIVLESSGDLINWTSSLPGTYGNTYSNRFFRVRAIAQ